MGQIMIGAFAFFVCANALFILMYTSRLFILALKKQYNLSKRGALKTEVKRIVYHIQFKMDNDENFKKSSQSWFSNVKELSPMSKLSIQTSKTTSAGFSGTI